MNIGLWILVVIGGAAGALSSLYLLIALPGTIAYKFYRKIRYGKSLYD